MTLEAALRDARAAGLEVRFEDFGFAARGRVVSEYDPQRRAIVIDAGVARALRSARGRAFADRFIVFAVRHELHHHRNGRCGEAEAHAAARRECGDDAAEFESAIRALRR